MGQLLVDEKLADFRFIVEETELPVHKSILSGEEVIFDHRDVSHNYFFSSHSGIR